MKTKLHVTIILIAVLFTACKPKIKFDWLMGDWEMQNSEEGHQTFEKWKKISPNEYRSLGFTLSNLDTSWSEELILKKEVDTWFLYAFIDNSETPTPFELYDITPTSFSSKNYLNDYPHIIKYWTQNNTLFASISDSLKQMEFTYEFIPTNKLK